MSFFDSPERAPRAAFAFILAAAVIGGLAAGTISATGDYSSMHMTAAADATDGSTSGDSSGSNTLDTTSQSCNAAIAAAIKGTTSGTQVGSNAQIDDKCIAAVFAPTDTTEANPTQDPKNYKCVGKLVQVSIDATGNKTETWTVGPNVPEGQCTVTRACDSSGQCIAARKVQGFTGSSLDDLMNPNSQTYKMMEVEQNLTPLNNVNDPSSQAVQDMIDHDLAGSALDTGSSFDQSGFKDAFGGLPNTDFPQSGDQSGLPAVPSANTGEPNSSQTSNSVWQLPQGSIDSKSLDPFAEQSTLLGGDLSQTSKYGGQYSTYGGSGITQTPDQQYSDYPQGTGTFPSAPTGAPQGGSPAGGLPVGGIPAGGGGGGGFMQQFLGGFLQGMARGMMQQAMQPQQQPAQPCSTDPNMYAQQQQQYQYQMQQYQYQLQQYQYQQQLNRYYMAQYGYNPYSPVYPSYPTVGYGSLYGIGGIGAPLPAMPTPCTPVANTSTGTGTTGAGTGAGGQICPNLPAQPDPSLCPGGAWQQGTTALNNGVTCPVWQCTASTSTTPTAQLSCSPQNAEASTTVAIAYSCANSVQSAGNGFSTGGALSGTATTSLANAPANATTATYGLTCMNGARTDVAQCTVNIIRPWITFAANPQQVPAGESAAVGWATGGMDSCTVSSPEDAAFNAANAAASSTAGMATSSPLSETTDFVLTCHTKSGRIMTATTTVIVSSNTQTGTVVTSADASSSFSHGDTVSIQWWFATSSTEAASSTGSALVLVDASTSQPIGVIFKIDADNGVYDWHVPASGTSCNPNSIYVCADAMESGHTYYIEAALYTPQGANLGDQTSGSNPTFLDWGFSDPLTSVD